MTLLTDLLGPFGPIIAIGGFGILLMAAAIPLMWRDSHDPLDRIRDEARGVIRDEGPKLRQTGRNANLDKFKQFLEPQDETEYSAIKLKLLRAGYHGKDAVRIYHFAQFALGIGLLALGLIYYMLKVDPDTATTTTMVKFILLPGGIGYMAPKYWVTRRVGERQQAIQDGFPDALDMLLVCVEAGQSLDQAILKVATELRASYPALADEFQIVSLEMKAGKDKTSVLNDLGERCGIQDISSFVTVLIQSQSFGTSIAEALRVYAGEMRDKRVMRAEEAANKLPTKMTLSTMGLTVPPLLIILVGPSIVSILNVTQ